MRVSRSKQSPRGQMWGNPILIQSQSEAEMSFAPKKKVKNCSKRPSASSYSEIPEVPSVRLTVQEMKSDPVKMLMKLEKQYEEFGAVKLITPTEWQPPFSFRYSDKGITTRIQHLHKLRFGKSFKQKQEAYNVNSFRNLAQDFEKNYKFKCAKGEGDRAAREESEYWALVNAQYEGPEWKFKTTVEYAADLPVKNHGSGFPISENRKTKDQHFDYFQNLFNLNNIYKSPSSILKIVDRRKEYISGVTTPWVYMGMMFSTFCWHVEDLWLNSLNYSHTGATKTWYIVPKSHKDKFDQYVQNKTGRSDLLNRITFMLDPLELIQQGIPVYKANQQVGQYVCTFYKAYHAGFSHGFNVGEAVNFASPYSLNYIKEALKSYQKCEGRGPSVLSYEWLVYQNKVRENSFPELNWLISSEYDSIIKQEYKRLQALSKTFDLRKSVQIAESCKYDRNSCSKCHNYQYLSSLRCAECGKNYCFDDVNECCGKQFQLVVREPNQDRAKILAFCKDK